MRKKNKRFKLVLIGLIAFSVIGYLTYTGIRETMAYYMTVDELLGQGSSNEKRRLRVGGEVVPGSVQWDARELNLSFRIGDDRSSILVSYQGVVPDSFQPGKEVIVEGSYRGNGMFRATTIMPRCPSKYE